eukprot:s1459_g6.t1
MGIEEVADMSPSQLAARLGTAMELSSCVSGIVSETLTQFPKMAREMSATDFVKCLWATAWLKDVAPDILKMVPALVEHFPGKAVEMTSEDVSDCLWALAVLKDAAPDVLDILPAFIEQISGKVDDMQQAQADRCLWSAQELQHVAPDLLQMVQSKVTPATQSLYEKDSRAGHLSNSLRALAETIAAGEPLAPEMKIHIMKSIMAELPSRAVEMNAAQLANSFWAVFRLRDEAPEVLKLVPVMVAQTHGKAIDMNASNLCCCLSGVVALKDVAPEMMKILPAILAQIKGKSADISARGLADCLRAVACLKDAAPEVMDILSAITEQIPSKKGEIQVTSLESLLLLDAAATMQDVAPDLLKRVMDTVLQLPAEGADVTAGHGAAALKALAELAGAAPKLVTAEVVSIVSAMVSTVLSKVQDMKPVEVARCIQALPVLMHVAPEMLKLLPALEPHFNAMASEMTGAELAGCLVIVKKLQCSVPELLKLVPFLLEPTVRKVSDMNGPDLCSCLDVVVELKDVAPEILKILPGIAARIRGDICNMAVPAGVICLWAAASLRDVAPDFLKIVPIIVADFQKLAAQVDTEEFSESMRAVAETDFKPGDFRMVELSFLPVYFLERCLWAAARLKNVTPEILQIVPAIVAQIAQDAGDMCGSTLSVYTWAAAMLKDAAPEVLKILPIVIAEIVKNLDNMDAEGLAYHLRAAGDLHDVGPEVVKMVPLIVAKLEGKVSNMRAKLLACCLTGAAELAEVTPAVLKIVPAVVAELSGKVADLSRGNLAASFKAAADLEDVVPEVLGVLPAIAAEIPAKCKSMDGGDLAMCMCAAARLKDATPDILKMFPEMLVTIPGKAVEMKPAHLASCLWAVWRLQDVFPDVLKMMPALMEQIPDGALATMKGKSDAEPDVLIEVLGKMFASRAHLPHTRQISEIEKAIAGRQDQVMQQTGVEVDPTKLSLEQRDAEAMPSNEDSDRCQGNPSEETSRKKRRLESPLESGMVDGNSSMATSCAGKPRATLPTPASSGLETRRCQTRHTHNAILHMRKAMYARLTASSQESHDGNLPLPTLLQAPLRSRQPWGKETCAGDASPVLSLTGHHCLLTEVTFMWNNQFCRGSQFHLEILNGDEQEVFRQLSQGASVTEKFSWKSTYSDTLLRAVGTSLWWMCCFVLVPALKVS